MGFCREIIRRFFWGPVLCFAVAVGQPSGMPGSSGTSTQYAGNLACRSCHPAASLQFFRNPHSNAAKASRGVSENIGCESCHGPGKAHVEAKGGKATIVAFSDLSASRVLDACLRCHWKEQNRANIRRSAHSQANITCTNCHSIHRSATPRFLLARQQTEVCYSCHNDVRAQFSQPVRHRVNEGFMKCSDCHNPHGTESPTWKMGRHPQLVDSGLQNEQPCLKCHTDKRGPFLYEHAALRVDGCESCHVSHGSPNARLLKRPAVFTLCLECHNGAGSFGRQADGIALQSATHNMADPRYRNCTTCHIRVHGSNGDRTFLR